MIIMWIILVCVISLSVAAIVLSSTSFGESKTTSSGTTGTVIENRIIVNTSNATKTLGGIIDSTKQYLIDGTIDMGSISVNVPVGGINISGLDVDVSILKSSVAGYTMFYSPLGGSGNVFMSSLSFEVSGNGSKLFSLIDATGFNTMEFNVVNFNNCTSLGTISSYRQGLENITGRFGGSPSLEMIGPWLGGWRITTSLTRQLSASMTEPLFKAGDGFSMSSRFLTDINCDLPANAAFLDFSDANFTESSLLQIQGAIFTRDGIFDAEDPNITPNISAADLESFWINNQGLPNTFVGGTNTIDEEATTTITAIDTFVPIAATTWISSDLQHFDVVAPNQLRHLGNIPRMFAVIINFIVDGLQNDVIILRITKFDNKSSTNIPQFDQERVINNFGGGGRDIAFFNVNFNVALNQGDYIFLEIANITGIDDLTAEVSSYFIIEER